MSDLNKLANEHINRMTDAQKSVYEQECLRLEKHFGFFRWLLLTTFAFSTVIIGFTDFLKLQIYLQIIHIICYGLTCYLIVRIAGYIQTEPNRFRILAVGYNKAIMEIMKGYNVDYLYHKDLNSEEYKMEKHIYKYFYIHHLKLYLLQ